ncbi:MAG: F0F1 ATP synthase subunit delta, partial [Candidatus Tectomicrobia bacterium]
MKGTAVARRYAKALIDLARRDDTVAETGEQLRQHRDVFRATDFQAIMRSPGVAVEVKTRVLTAILDQTQPGTL